MIVSNQRWRENYREYLRLLEDRNYMEVIFDEWSGGVSAIHCEHKFDKQIGPFGYRRGQYEIDAVNALRSHGHRIILQSEYPRGKCVRICDALYDGHPAEIKAIEGSGRNAVRTKIFNAVRQGASDLILVFPDSSLFSIERVVEGWKDNLRDVAVAEAISNLQIICVVENSLLEMEKPTW